MQLFSKTDECSLAVKRKLISYNINCLSTESQSCDHAALKFKRYTARNMKEIIARKNKKAYFVDTVRILCGSLLSVFFVVVILIFRKKIAFARGLYSLLDFTLLFLLLSAGLAVNGVRSLRNHRKMPDVMLTCDEEHCVILGKEILSEEIISLKGRFEFGRTGTILIDTAKETHKLYGVKNYAEVINSLDKYFLNKGKNNV